MHFGIQGIGDGQDGFAEAHNVPLKSLLVEVWCVGQMVCGMGAVDVNEAGGGRLVYFVLGIRVVGVIIVIWVAGRCNIRFAFLVERHNGIITDSLGREPYRLASFLIGRVEGNHNTRHVVKGD